MKTSGLGFPLHRHLTISRAEWAAQMIEISSIVIDGCVVVDPNTVRIYSSLPVRNLLPSDWTPRGTPKDGWWNNYGQGIPKYEMVTATFHTELATKIPEVSNERSHL